MLVTRFVAASDASWWRSIPSLAGYPVTRFLLVPACLLLLFGALRSSTPARWIALTTALFVQGVLFPEALLFLAVVAIVAILWCTHEWRAGRARAFAPLLWCTLTGVLLGVVFVVYLAIIGALGDFFGYFQTFAFGHTADGHLPARQRPEDRTADARPRSSARARGTDDRVSRDPVASRRASTPPTGLR